MGRKGPFSGKRIGKHYLIGDLLGGGGFGAVYKGEHLELGRTQAIKVLLEQHLTNKDFHKRFLAEARLLAKLNHPHIVHVDDFLVEQDKAYLVMPFLSGGSFQDILQKRKTQKKFLSTELVLHYLGQICEALDYAHKRGVVHLDLKPPNLLINEDEALLLSDFGLAHIMNQGAVQGGESLLFGTPHYMAPEHINGHPEKSSDLYALGIIAFQMFANRLPFEGTKEAIFVHHFQTEVPSLKPFQPKLATKVDAIFRKALAKEARHRYKTAYEFLVALQEAVGNAQAPVKPPIELVTTQITARVNPPRINNWGREAALRIVAGKGHGAVYPCRNKPTFSIGQSPQNDIPLDDREANPRHATLLCLNDGSYGLRDENSVYGTKVRGELLTPGQIYPLQEDDRIEIGQTVLRFIFVPR